MVGKSSVAGPHDFEHCGGRGHAARRSSRVERTGRAHLGRDEFHYVYVRLADRSTGRWSVRCMAPTARTAAATYHAGVFNPLTAGTHNYSIQVTDSSAQTTTATGTFVVATVGPVISQVVVAEATYRDGVLNAGEQGVITWAATSSNTITNRSLTVDNKPATANYGPDVPDSTVADYASLFGSVSTGTHNFTIRVTDNKGATSTLSGTFSVSKVGGTSVVATASVTALTAEQIASMMAEADRQLTVANSAGMWAEGNGLTPHSGDWGYGMLGGSDTVGPADRAISVQHIDCLPPCWHGLSQVLDEGQSTPTFRCRRACRWASIRCSAKSASADAGRGSSPAADQSLDCADGRRGVRFDRRRGGRSGGGLTVESPAKVARFDPCACQAAAWFLLSFAHFIQVAAKLSVKQDGLAYGTISLDVQVIRDYIAIAWLGQHGRNPANFTACRSRRKGRSVCACALSGGGHVRATRSGVRR